MPAERARFPGISLHGPLILRAGGTKIGEVSAEEAADMCEPDELPERPEVEESNDRVDSNRETARYESGEASMDV
jgi:hypothetical protein